MHSGNGVHEEMDRRAIACFDEALNDVGFPDDERLRQVLHEYFAWATRTTMSRYHQSADDLPDGLEIPHWSWDGLVVRWRSQCHRERRRGRERRYSQIVAPGGIVVST